MVNRVRVWAGSKGRIEKTESQAQQNGECELQKMRAPKIVLAHSISNFQKSPVRGRDPLRLG